MEPLIILENWGLISVCEETLARGGRSPNAGSRQLVKPQQGIRLIQKLKSDSTQKRKWGMTKQEPGGVHKLCRGQVWRKHGAFSPPPPRGVLFQ